MGQFVSENINEDRARKTQKRDQATELRPRKKTKILRRPKDVAPTAARAKAVKNV